MKLVLLLALNIASTIGLPTEGCNPNGCLMDLLGTGAPHILTASSDCSSFVDATTYTQTVPTQYVRLSICGETDGAIEELRPRPWWSQFLRPEFSWRIQRP